jgi:hypothetical protein
MATKTKILIYLGLVLIIAGCAAPKFDYTAYEASKPQSILVLPPVNNSVEVDGEAAVYSAMVKPIAEAGYYVLPPTLVTETFRQNGFTEAAEIHAISIERLNKIFGADAVLYVKINQYGQKYFVVGSAAIVGLEARLVDMDTGTEIWNGISSASSNENSSGNAYGLAGLLIEAAVEQIVGELLEAAYPTAKVASTRLLSPNMPNALLRGHRHPNSDF